MIPDLDSLTMSMNRPVVITCLILFCAALTVSQNKPRPNLSGSWIVDSTKSEKTNNFIEDSENSITIEQNDPEIKFTSKLGSLSIPVVHYTDGRGETFKSQRTGGSIQSKTKWDGDKLVIHYVGGGIVGLTGARNVNVIEEWKLSKDGQTLTKKIILIPPRNAPDRVNAVPVTQSNQEYKKVYNRAPA